MALRNSNLLFVCPHYPKVGGVEIVTALLVDFFRSKNFNVRILSLESSENSENDRHAEVVIRMPGTLNSDENQSFIRECIAENDVACVFNQGTFSNCYLQQASNPNTQFINTFHGMPFWEWQAIRSQSLPDWLKVKSGAENPLKEGLRWCISRIHPTWAYPFLKSFYRKQIESCACYVVLEEAFKLELERILYQGNSNDRIVSIANPLPELTTAPCTKEKTVLYVGRLSRSDKRVDRLLRSWKRIESEVPDWKLQLVGDGNDRSKLEQLSRTLGLQRVEFLGHQASEIYYRKASILCVTSTFEGGPLVIPEAQRCETVPIAYSSSISIRNMIDDGINGLLIQPFDEEAYAEKLKALLINPEKLQSMARNAPLKVEGRNKEEVGQRWLNLLNRF